MLSLIHIFVQDADTPLEEQAAAHPDTVALIVRSEKVTPAIMDALPSLKPVSYTHLGHNPPSHAHAAPVLFLPASPHEPPSCHHPDFTAFSFQRATAVSYTHLDVYKRQLDRLWSRRGWLTMALHSGLDLMAAAMTFYAVKVEMCIRERSRPGR